MVETGGDNGCRNGTSERDLEGDVHQLEDACVQERKAWRLISGTEPGGCCTDTCSQQKYFEGGKRITGLMK